MKQTISRSRMGFLPHFSLPERDRRWSALRRGMAEHQLDALLAYGTDAFLGYGMANFRYLTQIGGHHGGFAIFAGDSTPVVFNAPPHEHQPCNAWLTAQQWIDDIRPNRGIGGVAAVLREMGLQKARLGLIGYRSGLAQVALPYPMYEALRQALPEVELVEATDLVDSLRLVKSPEEIRMLEMAGAVAEKVVRSMIRTAHEGVRENELVAEMMRTAVAEGGEPQLFTMLTSGSIEGNGELRYLLHGIAPPNGPTSRPLQKGDVVLSEFHCSVAGYLSATEFSLTLGPAPEPRQRIHQVQVACLEQALSYFRPGVTLKEVWEAIRQPCLQAGLDYLELGFHGHGLASPEFPTVVYKPGEGVLDGTGLEEYRLSENMVFGTNIDIYDPRWKPDIGLMFGDTVVVTHDGGRRLVNVPFEFSEIG